MRVVDAPRGEESVVVLLLYGSLLQSTPGHCLEFCYSLYYTYRTHT